MKRKSRQTPDSEPSRSDAMTPKNTNDEHKDHTNDMIIVGIGASAGGLDAMQKLLPGLPGKAGMAFVVVQHMAPKYQSRLPSLLARYTAMPVESITDGVTVAPDTLYITPPNKNVAFSNGRLMLKKGFDIGPRPSIDSFFTSLAEEKMAHAVGIILSGTGTDGAHGIRAIKSNDGITMAQTPDSARFDGMPKAAIETGLVDLVLSPDKIGEGLQTARKYPHLMVKVPVDRHLDEIGTVLELVHHHSGVDFSEYKKSTIHRRISRRMAIHQLEHPEEYVTFIQKHPEEAIALSKDMLISVTGFFRDDKAFESMALKLREVFKSKKTGDTFRAWVPGCSTGEEAYSIAILIADMLGENLRNYRIQIFATDIDDESIQLARKGVYPVAALTGTDVTIVKKYFTSRDNAVTVKKHIRDLVVLARQDLIKDTNFIHLDLISCRNLLIYIQTELQRKLLSLFHFSLNPNGLLFLGKSESIGNQTDLFKSIDAKWKIYQRKEAPAKRLPELMKRRQMFQLTTHKSRHKQQDSGIFQEGDFFDSLLGMMDCCAVVTDESANIHYIRGDVSPYLKLPEGNVKEHLNALEMVRPEIRFSLQSMIYKANKEGTIVTSNTIGLGIDRQGVIIKIGPVQGESFSGYLLIVFTPVEPPPSTLKRKSALEDTDQKRIHELEQELGFTREHLQDTIEELETSTEELQSLNQELQAANEELQATNEELETSNEELQASNEELNTVNDELRAKSEEAAELVDNLTASEKRYRLLVDNMNEALMLCEIEYGSDKQPTDLIIQQANKAFEDLLSIRSRYLPLRAGAAKLQELVSLNRLEQFESIAKGEKPKQFELYLEALDKDLTLSVYNIGDDRLGVVCRDDTERKRAEERLRVAKAAAKLGIHDYDVASGRIYWDGQVREFWGVGPDPPITYDIFMSGLHPDDREPTQQCVDRALDPEGNGLYYAEYRVIATDSGVERWVAATGQTMFESGKAVRLVGTAQDITEQKRIEENLAASERQYRELLETANSVIIRWDNQGIIRFINDYGLRFFGYSAEELFGHDVMTIVPKVEKSSGRNLDALVKDIVLHPENYTHVPSENVTKAGHTVWVAWTNKAILDDDGQVQEILAIGNDITSLKETEAALAASEKKFRNIVSNTPLGMHLYELENDGSLRFIEANPAADRILGVDNSQFVGQLIEEAFPNIARTDIPQKFRKIAKNGGFWHGEDITYQDERISGAFENFNFQVSAGQVASFFVDITERKQNEEMLRESKERIQAALTEKEVLLKEIHHRVKNNMQVISSLVDLQADVMEDDATQEMLIEIKHRIRSMALVHEKLYQAGDLANVEFADYANSLLNYLRQTHKTGKFDVSLETALEPVLLPVTMAVPCGLILNELVSNAFMHAFKGRESGKISITFGAKSSKSKVQLSVRDDGVGLPSKMDWRQATSLGLRLVQMLTKQLGATVDVRNDSGTEFSITFERPNS